MVEKFTCKQPIHRPYTEGGMTFKDRQVVCDSPISKVSVGVEQCANCGSIGTPCLGMDCPGAPKMSVTQAGFRCSEGHWQPIEG